MPLYSTHLESHSIRFLVVSLKVDNIFLSRWWIWQFLLENFWYSIEGKTISIRMKMKIAFLSHLKWKCDGFCYFQRQSLAFIWNSSESFRIIRFFQTADKQTINRWVNPHNVRFMLWTGSCSITSKIKQTKQWFEVQFLAGLHFE